MTRTFTALAAATFATAAIFASPAAYAADAQVRYGDLDLATPAGQHELSRRVDTAARAACGSALSTGSLIDPAYKCRDAIRRQVAARLQAKVPHEALGG